jgi:hypothetical protein
MNNSLHNLPPMYQGLLYIISGAMILLYALGIIGKSIGFLVIIVALYLIALGCFKLELFKKIGSLIHKKKQ